MKIDGRTCLVCSCEGTMPLDPEALGRALGAEPPHVHRQLCRAELDRLAAADGPLLVACTQERAVFEETLAERIGAEAAAGLRVTNIRERAGWSKEADAATPKIAALLAEAALPVRAAAPVVLKSEGVILIYGRDETATAAARMLADTLDVTVLLTRPGDVTPPRRTDFPVLKGTIRNLKGHLGAFEAIVDDYAAPRPSSRAALSFGPARDGAVSRCDIVLDLSGGAPLTTADSRRDGYLRADPNDPVAVQKAVFAAAGLVGEFEKPRYIAYRAELCAHSRNRRTGCARCLDVCPAGAIAPDGDHVALDAYLCAGCGNCHAVCPTGAATYAHPPPDALLERVRVLLSTYLKAGGARPVLLVHDEAHGAPLVDLLARAGDGLPARVIPLQVNEIPQAGIELFAAALAQGASEVRVLASARKRDDREGLIRVLSLAETVLEGLGYGAGRCALVETDDPDDLGAQLYGLTQRDGTPNPKPFLPLGDKRSLMMLSLSQLHAAAPAPADVVPLPAGAPFGTIEVKVDGCTLCFSCFNVCPTGALADNPEKPQLSFTEAACVQCGLCAATCPEHVISLSPRLDFTERARAPRIVKEEEPAHCIRCGKAFGVRSSVERIVAQLADRHWMYRGPDSPVARIRMCADCRVIAQTESNLDPYAGPPRPKPVTSDDYLR